MTSGSMAYLKAKANGDSSMPVKRKASEDAWGARSARPVRDGESQTAQTSVSSDASVHSLTTASNGGAIAIRRLSRRRLNFPHDGR